MKYIKGINPFLIIGVIVVIGIFVYDMYYRDMLSNNYSYTRGIVVRVENGGDIGPVTVYKYYINNRMYEGSRWKNAKDYKISIGDTFIVKYSVKDPSISEIYYNLRLRENLTDLELREMAEGTSNKRK